MFCVGMRVVHVMHSTQRDGISHPLEAHCGRVQPLTGMPWCYPWSGCALHSAALKKDMREGEGGWGGEVGGVIPYRKAIRRLTVAPRGCVDIVPWVW